MTAMPRWAVPTITQASILEPIGRLAASYVFSKRRRNSQPAERFVRNVLVQAQQYADDHDIAVNIHWGTGSRSTNVPWHYTGEATPGGDAPADFDLLMVSCNATNHRRELDRKAAALSYRVRVGDDGRTQFRSDNYGEALDFAREFSRTNSLGRSEILDDHGKVARLLDGQVEWKRRSVR